MLGRVASVAVSSVGKRQTKAVAKTKTGLCVSSQRRFISQKAALENLKFNSTVSVALNTIRDAPGAKKKVCLGSCSFQRDPSTTFSSFHHFRVLLYSIVSF